ncbi:hypothetical protein ES707_20557 [subsurface metagenome]
MLSWNILVFIDTEDNGYIFITSRGGNYYLLNTASPVSHCLAAIGK